MRRITGIAGSSSLTAAETDCNCDYDCSVWMKKLQIWQDVAMVVHWLLGIWL